MFVWLIRIVWLCLFEQMVDVLNGLFMQFSVMLIDLLVEKFVVLLSVSVVVVEKFVKVGEWYLIELLYGMLLVVVSLLMLFGWNVNQFIVRYVVLSGLRQLNVSGVWWLSVSVLQCFEFRLMNVVWFQIVFVVVNWLLFVQKLFFSWKIVDSLLLRFFLFFRFYWLGCVLFWIIVYFVWLLMLFMYVIFVFMLLYSIMLFCVYVFDVVFILMIVVVIVCLIILFFDFLI